MKVIEIFEGDLAKKLVSAFNDGYKDGYNAASEKYTSELKTCRNELCLRCGNYKNSHRGACDGCRWKDGG